MWWCVHIDLHLFVFFLFLLSRYSEHRAAYDNISWTREGEDICYYQSCSEQPSTRRRKKKKFFKCTFTYTFRHSNDVVFFAYTFPYTYVLQTGHVERSSALWHCLP